MQPTPRPSPRPSPTPAPEAAAAPTPAPTRPLGAMGPRDLRRRRRFRRPPTWLITTGVVLAIFVGALWLWAGPTVDGRHIDGLSNLSTQGFAPPAAPDVSVGDPSKGRSVGKGSTTTGAPHQAPPISVPTGVGGVTNGGSYDHIVRLTVTSDAVLASVGYQVLGGNPSSGKQDGVQGPWAVTRSAKGYGLVAALGVQAGPGATTTTITVIRDGRVMCSRTAHGPWAVAVCYG